MPRNGHSRASIDRHQWRQAREHREGRARLEHGVERGAGVPRSPGGAAGIIAGLGKSAQGNSAIRKASVYDPELSRGLRAVAMQPTTASKLHLD